MCRFGDESAASHGLRRTNARNAYLRLDAWASRTDRPHCLVRTQGRCRHPARAIQDRAVVPVANLCYKELAA
jgi:hypothetical protein